MSHLGVPNLSVTGHIFPIVRMDSFSIYLWYKNLRSTRCCFRSFDNLLNEPLVNSIVSVPSTVLFVLVNSDKSQSFQAMIH